MSDDGWQPIDDDAKRIDYRYDGSLYGRHILAWPARDGAVSRVRWWQSERNEDGRWQNFLDDGGCAQHPTHYMELPEPPR